MAIFPVSFKPPLSQNNGQAGKEGTPHSPLLPERLEKLANIIKEEIYQIHHLQIAYNLEQVYANKKCILMTRTKLHIAYIDAKPYIAVS